MKGAIFLRNEKESPEKEVKYIGSEEGGKMIPVKKRSNKSQLTFIVTIISLICIIIILCAVIAWLGNIPNEIETQRKEVEKLENTIKEQQQLIKQLGAQESETKEDMNEHQDKDVVKSAICALEAVPGPCTTSSIQRWHYHLESGTCRQFTYGGCLGNLNNFPTAMECEKTCSGYIQTNPTKPTNNINVKEDYAKEEYNACHERPVAGPCRGQHLRYYYDPSQDTCNQFSYGGCAGNANNFLSVSDCEDTCRSSSSNSKKALKAVTTKKTLKSSAQGENICQMNADPGACSDNHNRWFYSQDAGTCQQFLWSGCGGNFNNFLSQAKCEARCGLGKARERNQGRANCMKPKEQGSCKGIFERFHYNAKTESCEKFVFGGCGGNENNFLSKEKCESYCLEQVGAEDDSKERSVDEICSSPSELGTCRGFMEHFYYNIITEKCEPFTYSGCGGNSNNFKSLQDCKDFCASDK